MSSLSFGTIGFFTGKPIRKIEAQSCLFVIFFVSLFERVSSAWHFWIVWVKVQKTFESNSFLNWAFNLSRITVEDLLNFVLQFPNGVFSRLRKGFGYDMHFYELKTSQILIRTQKGGEKSKNLRQVFMEKNLISYKTKRLRWICKKWPKMLTNDDLLKWLTLEK